MIQPIWVISGLALGAVVAIAWPRRGVRSRLRPPTPALSLNEFRSLPVRLTALAIERPKQTIAVTALLGALLAGVVGGPIAALVSFVYCGLTARAVARRLAGKRDAAARSAQLDDLTALAADLRAGLPPSAAAELTSRPAEAHTPQAVREQERLTQLATAIWRLAEHTGAPAAELVERIESDARTADRARATAAAQAAGAQATAMLLAALPLGGIALGYMIGADPVHVLLHTTLGAACATAAVLLQCAGLAWSTRLTAGAVR